MSSGRSRPYTPSWVDILAAWVDRLPGEWWLYYLGLGLVLVLLQSGIAWMEGALPIGTVSAAQAYLAIATAFILALLHYSDVRAGQALATLRATREERERFHFMLTTLPAGWTLLASTAAVAIVPLTEAVGEPYRLEAFDTFPISASVLRIVYMITWWVFGALVYHTFRHLRLINRIYTEHTRINLFRMKPLYAFSGLAALTAGGLAALPIGFLIASGLTEPGRLHPVDLVVILGIELVAIATFLWPQLGIHRLQIAEKDRLLDDANQRLEAAIAELHRRVDEGNLEGSTDLNMTMASLGRELNTLSKIHTWPWQPETVRWLATALILPLGLWIFQLFLQRAFVAP